MKTDIKRLQKRYDVTIKELEKNVDESKTTLQQELEEKVNKIKDATQQKIDALVERSLSMEEHFREDLESLRMFVQLKHAGGRSKTVSGKDISQMFKPLPPYLT